MQMNGVEKQSWRTLGVDATAESENKGRGGILNFTFYFANYWS